MMHRDQGGFLLITTLFIALVVGIVVFGSTATSLIDRQVSASQRDATQAYYLAQAGLDQLMTAVFDAYSLVPGGGDPGVCESPISTGVSVGNLALEPGVPSDVIPMAGQSSQFGGYVLEYWLSGDLIVLRSRGVVPNTGGDQPRGQSTLQAIATLTGSGQGVWDNALLAKVLEPSTGGGFVGRVAVFGSIHVVNSDVDLNRDEIAGELSGNAGIYNNYRGDNNNDTAQGGNNVLANATRTLGADRAAIPDLCTRVKIDKGNLVLNKGAAADLGYEPQEPVDDPMDNLNALWGLYFGNSQAGVTWNLMEKDGNTYKPLEPTPANRVYVRNPINYYDEFGRGVPTLSTGFPNDGVSGLNLSAADVESCGLIHRTPAQGSRPETIQLLLPPPGATGRIECGDLNSGRLVYDTSTDTLTATRSDGRPVSINVSGLDVVFNGSSGLVRFDGEMSFRVERGVSIEGGLAPVNGDRHLEEFGSALGLIAKGPVTVSATAANPDVAALIYSEESVYMSGQAVVTGAVVSETVITQRVPRVLYHPDVASAGFRLGMPGTDSDSNPRAEFSRFSVERQ